MVSDQWIVSVAVLSSVSWLIGLTTGLTNPKASSLWVFLIVTAYPVFMLTSTFAVVDLIRIGGHLSCGGYDVQTDGRHTDAASAAPVH